MAKESKEENYYVNEAILEINSTFLINTGIESTMEKINFSLINTGIGSNIRIDPLYSLNAGIEFNMGIDQDQLRLVESDINLKYLELFKQISDFKENFSVQK
ncbi:hypothetical protein U3516DRAFT_753622 [Neocallimastix sp. 'constans']